MYEMPPVPLHHVWMLLCEAACMLGLHWKWGGGELILKAQYHVRVQPSLGSHPRRVLRTLQSMVSRAKVHISFLCCPILWNYSCNFLIALHQGTWGHCLLKIDLIRCWLEKGWGSTRGKNTTGTLGWVQYNNLIQCNASIESIPSQFITLAIHQIASVHQSQIPKDL